MRKSEQIERAGETAVKVKELLSLDSCTFRFPSTKRENHLIRFDLRTGPFRLSIPIAKKIIFDDDNGYDQIVLLAIVKTWRDEIEYQLSKLGAVTPVS